MPFLKEEQFKGPVPGQGMTAEPQSRPWFNPPQYNTVEEALEYYLDKEISYDNFTSIMPKVEHQMNFNWITSGNHTLYDYLFFSDEGLKFVAEISNELGEA